MRRNRAIRWPSVTLMFLLAWTLAAHAQDETPQEESASAAPEATGASPTESPATEPPAALQEPVTATGWPTVTGVRSNNKYPNRASLGDSIVLHVPGLKGYLDTDEDKCDKLVLFLDEVAVDGSSPESCDPYQETVRFRLDRTAKSDDAWHTLLAEPVGFIKEVDVSAGPEGRLMFPTTAREFYLEVLPATEFYGFAVMLAVGLVGMFVLARRTALLRDPAPGAGVRGPYSLSRFQLAFWSFLVVGAYLFIWMITEELDTITGSVLVLLGIGSGTALGAAMIDKGKPAAATPPPPAAPADAAAVPADAAAAPKPPATSQGFLRDVLSDENGISLYRFQLFIWTLVLGVIFCASVYHSLSMPQFSTTLLGLMGISSGTYLGFKVPEGTAKE